jgi:hypothetical protein
MRKVAGRDGFVESWMGDRALLVRHGKRPDEVATTDWTELLVLDAAPAGQASTPSDLANPRRKGKTSKAEASAAIAAGLQELEAGTPEAALADAVGSAA